MSDDQAIAVNAPEIPQEAIDFAKAAAALAEKYGVRDFEMTVRVDTGIGTRFRKNWLDVQEKVTVSYSGRDGRGRPRRRLNVRADVQVTVPIINEPDSSN